MSDSRTLFLERVHQAVTAGNRAGIPTAIEPRGTIGNQGAGSDPLDRFCSELKRAKGHAHVVDREAAIACVLEIVKARSAQRILIGNGTVVDALNLRDPLQEIAAEVLSVGQVSNLTANQNRAAFFNADIGISGVDYLIAETGCLVVLARSGDARSLSLLPPVHIAVADHLQILPDLFDLFAVLEKGVRPANIPSMPSCLTFITGPSKTGDIELKLVTGVHGPGELHVVILNQ